MDECKSFREELRSLIKQISGAIGFFKSGAVSRLSKYLWAAAVETEYSRPTPVSCLSHLRNLAARTQRLLSDAILEPRSMYLSQKSYENRKSIFTWLRVELQTYLRNISQSISDLKSAERHKALEVGIDPSDVYKGVHGGYRSPLYNCDRHRTASECSGPCVWNWAYDACEDRVGTSPEVLAKYVSRMSGHKGVPTTVMPPDQNPRRRRLSMFLPYFNSKRSHFFETSGRR